MRCPRCAAPLATATLGPVEYARCTGCGGGVVPIRSLEAALAALAPVSVPAADTPMAPVPDPGGDLACPRCSHRMSQGGYLEQPIVRIDRCVSCMLLFA